MDESNGPSFASVDESDRDVLPSSSSSSHLTIPTASYSPAGTRPHVMTLKQLAPTPMDAMEELGSMIAEASGQMPMMMPMPLTTALQSTMQKSMKGLNDFMMQMSMSMPNVGQHQSSPCAAMGMSGGGGGGGGGSKGPDLMALLRQLTDSLNPMNFLNSILQMMKSTSMSMQSSMSNSGMMGGGCGGGGD